MAHAETQPMPLRHHPLGSIVMSAALLTLGGGCLTGAETASPPPRPPRPPNIIVILGDDLARGDVGCFGQKLIRTPHFDRLAAEGMRFTQCYSGTSVCSPSRASLLTGMHSGHCPIRGNRRGPKGIGGQMPLPDGTLTVAGVLSGAGYATACVGKWGLGMFATAGSPLKRGFDHFFGYNCHDLAHDYFPPALFLQDQSFPLDGKTYAPDLIQRNALDWIRSRKDQPFFLFYATTLPHWNLEIDALGAYAATDWGEQEKTYAAMVSRLDQHTGEILDLLKELDIDRQTLVIVAGDNGSNFAPTSDIGKRFDQAQGLRGYKRSLYEGGIRQAGLIRWPGTVPAGVVSEVPWAFWDLLPTAAALAGATLPTSYHSDGISLVPLLRGGDMPKRECFYWELHERGGFTQAVRFGDWKAVRPAANAPLELYDLATDLGESRDLATANPDAVARAEALMRAARSDDPTWPIAAARR